MRTRTISSTTVPTSLHQSTVSSVTSVQFICSSTVTGPRPRGRPPRRKNLNYLSNGKKLKQTTGKQSDESESKVCDLTSTVTGRETATTSIEHAQRQHSTNQCNGINNYDNDQENSIKIVTSFNVDTINKRSKLFPDTKNKECTIADRIGKKKSCGRKRKQSDIEEFVSKKRLLIAGSSKDSLVAKKNQSVKVLPEKSNMAVDLVKYGFLAGCSIVESYRRNTDMIATTFTHRSYFYGRTYWPINWEYSAASLTGHVQKKATKDTLRKIRLICGEGTSTKSGYPIPTLLKTNSTFKKYQTSVIQRRGSATKFTASLSSVEMSNRHNSMISPTVVKRQKPGRPPGRKNKLLQAVLKANSPRKSPRQHASTLAAIMSNKVLSTDKPGTQQSDKLDLDTSSNQNSLDMDGPCILTVAVPKHEHMPVFRHHRHRRQLDHQHAITKRRRRRSITPPPPKLCAQQPAPQRIPLNSTTVDQEVVKLRTKHVDVVRRRARDERLRAAFVCQQLHRVQESAEQNRRNLAQEIVQNIDEDERNYQFSNNSLILPLESSQDQIWSYLTDDTNQEPDNLCLQIMYEQTADKRFLCTNLTNETLQMYYQQRDLALAERLTNNHCGDNMSSDLGTDMISVGNKRKKKRPNMTGWPKEKRRKIIASASSSMITTINAINGDSDEERNNVIKRRRAAAALQQRLRRQRLKLEQQQLAKQKSKVKVVTPTIPKRPGRPGRRPGPLKKNKTATHHRTISVSSNGTTASSNTSSTITAIKRKKIKVPKQRRRRRTIQNKTTPTESVGETTIEPSTIVKRSCGRPRGSVGKRQRIKIKILQRRRRNQTSLSCEQHKENVIQEQPSSGKLKCVISTRNNRMKLLPTSSSSSPGTSNQKKTVTGSKTKKSSAAYNLSSSCLTSLSSPVTVVGKTTRTTAKRRRLQQQQQQQMASTTVTWDAGRPKRYHSTNHGRNASGVAVEEDCCFVGSQPFEQHCPGVGCGLSHNTVLENQQDHQKENSVQVGG